MKVQIPVQFFLVLVPWVLVWLVSLTFSGQRTGGGYFPASSDRDAFWMLGVPLALLLSVTAIAVYYMGFAHGWWGAK